LRWLIIRWIRRKIFDDIFINISPKRRNHRSDSHHDDA
jgi:hypothetical protein